MTFEVEYPDPNALRASVHSHDVATHELPLFRFFLRLAEKIRNYMPVYEPDQVIDQDDDEYDPDKYHSLKVWNILMLIQSSILRCTKS